MEVESGVEFGFESEEQEDTREVICGKIEKLIKVNIEDSASISEAIGHIVASRLFQKRRKRQGHKIRVQR